MKPLPVVLLLCLLVLKCSALPSSQEPTGISGRIVGGVTQPIINRPFQVSVTISTDRICGGSLIKWNWVLTAANCTNTLSPAQITVRAGMNLLNPVGIPRRVQQIVQHEQYDGGNEYNLSLLKLRTPYIPSPTIGIASLATSLPTPGTPLYQLGSNQILGGVQNLTLLSNLDVGCATYYTKVISFCVGWAEGFTDSCQGDSGGPLVNKFNEFIGIVSWGKGCVQPGQAGIYTSIPAFNDWIQNNIQ